MEQRDLLQPQGTKPYVYLVTTFKSKEQREDTERRQIDREAIVIPVLPSYGYSTPPSRTGVPNLQDLMADDLRWNL